MASSDRGKGKNKERGSSNSSRSKKRNAATPPNKILFAQESKVEVSSDEEGFKDAWYVATILKPPSFSPNSRQSVKGKALVKYETLVSEEDESKSLMEYVDLRFIRPLPPLPEEGKEESFEPHDVVDAFYRDGWWKGVVNVVAEAETGKSYSVVFDNPPHEIKFGGSKLRFHLDWVNGSWRRPSKQKRMKGLKLFSKGIAVEVKPEKQNSEEVWFPATILDEVGFNSFLVMPEGMENNESGLMNITVDAFHIQPRHPNLDVKYFRLLERVDAFYNSGWRCGFIFKILGDDQYVVLLKHTEEEKQFSSLEIRPHLYWNKGKWISYCWDTDALDGRVKSRRANKNAKNSLVVESFANSHMEESPCQQSSAFAAKSERKRVKKDTPNSETSQVHLPKKFKTGDTANSSSSPASIVDLLPVDTSNQGQVFNVVSFFYGPIGTSHGDFSSAQETNFPKEVDMSCHEKEDEHIVLEGGAKGRDNQDLTLKEVELPMTTFKKPAVTYGEQSVPECGARGMDNQDSVVEGVPIKTCEQSADEVHNVSEVGACDMDNQDSANEWVMLPLITREEHAYEKHNLSDGGASAMYNQDHVVKEVELPKITHKVPADEEYNVPEAGTSDVDNQDYMVKEVELPGITCEEPADEDRNVLECGASHVGNQDHAVKEVDLLSMSCEEPPETSAVVDRADYAAVDVNVDVAGTSGGILIALGNLHLSVCSEGHSPGDTGKQHNDSRKREGERARMESIMNDVLLEPVENNEIPFVKSSPIWEGVESMEAFQYMPQKPHFRPLVKCPEESREGMAIGFMVVFANLVEKTSKLKIDVPRDVFDRYLTGLADLEVLGFDVKPVMDRLNKLLLIKERRGLLQDLSTGLQVKIVEKAVNITKLEEDVDVIDKKMRELGEKRASLVAMKVVKELEVASLQADAGATAENFSDVDREFESAATASW